MTQISRARRLPSVQTPRRSPVPRRAGRGQQTTSAHVTRKKSENRSRLALAAAGHDPATDSARIPIHFGRLKPLFALLGITPRCSYIDVTPDLVGVRMGWAFGADVPRTSIRSARRVRDAISIGVHGRRGRWLVNGAAGPLVAVTIDPPAPARVLGFPVRLRELIVSVDDPDALIGELSPVRAAVA
jgi:hypothetical protein